MTTSNTSKTSRKKVAESFLRLIVARKIREAYETYTVKGMRHHNPYFAGDAASLQKGMEDAHTQFPDTTIDIKHALEDGDFVAVHSHVRMKPDSPGIAVVHLFRFEGDRVAEMWDVGQEIPENSPNENGAF